MKIIDKNGGSKRVAIYIRVSTVHQIDKDSIPMQRQDLKNYCEFVLGTKDYVLFEDAGYSGKNTDRPRYQEMMNQIRAGLFTHVLVWKIDRISRNLLDFASMYSELKELNVVFVSKSEQFDTSNAMGEAMLKIILVFAELERNMTSERVTATMLSRASNGLWNGGRIPFGYDYNPEDHTFSINAKEANIVTLMHSRYLELNSLVLLARELNEAGYRSRNGTLWSATTIMLILQSVFYCGDYRYNTLKDGKRQNVRDESEWITVYDHHPAIVDRDIKDQIIARLKSNRRIAEAGTRRTGNVHVFAGLCICDVCGKMMSCSTTSSKYKWVYTNYFCGNQRKSKQLCYSRITSDRYVGEFVFNFILNIINIKKTYESVMTDAQLEQSLLSGSVFSNIEYIYPENILDVRHVLESSPIEAVIYKDMPERSRHNRSNLEILRSERERASRALQRLVDLYLYSDDSIPESEFIRRKVELTDKIDSIDQQIGIEADDNWDQQLSDEQFIKLASEFVITQRLTNRNYVSYKSLATSIDNQIIYDFVHSVIEVIYVCDQKITKLVFKNGLSFSFKYKELE